MAPFSYGFHHIAASQLLTMSRGVTVPPPVSSADLLEAAQFVTGPKGFNSIVKVYGDRGEAEPDPVDEVAMAILSEVRVGMAGKGSTKGIYRFAETWKGAPNVPKILREQFEKLNWPEGHSYFDEWMALHYLGLALLVESSGPKVFLDPHLLYMPKGDERLFEASAFMMEEAVTGILTPLVRGEVPRVALFGPGSGKWDLLYVRRFLDRLSSVALKPSHLDVFELDTLDSFDLNRHASQIDWGRHSHTIHTDVTEGDYNLAETLNAHFILHLHPLEHNGDLMHTYFRHLVPGGLILLQGDALGDDPFSYFKNISEPYLRVLLGLRWHKMFETPSLSFSPRICPGVVLFQREDFPLEDAEALKAGRYRPWLESETP